MNSNSEVGNRWTTHLTKLLIKFMNEVYFSDVVAEILVNSGRSLTLLL